MLVFCHLFETTLTYYHQKRIMSTIFSNNLKKFKTFFGGLLIYYLFLQKSIVFETLLQKIDNYCHSQ